MKKDAVVRILLSGVILLTGAYYIQKSISTKPVVSGMAEHAYADIPNADVPISDASGGGSK